MTHNPGRRLMAVGMVLFSLALLEGTISQWLPSPRLGLATHLEGVLGGMLLVVLGLVWPHSVLPAAALKTVFWLPIIGMFASFAFHLFAACYPSGGYWMPIAAPGLEGTTVQEAVVTAGVVTVGITMLPTTLLVTWGLWRSAER